MRLENTFTIDAPIEKAWEALNTPRTIAPCFPGATLTDYEGDTFTGTVKVRLGPISLTYKGKGTYVSRDDEAHQVVVKASGRDAKGNGTADATVTGSMVADGPNRTAVTMVTDMTITGRPAQFGRGLISDIADKIIGQFADCVAEKLAPELEAAASSSAGAVLTATGTDGSANGAVGGAGTATVTSAPPAAQSVSTHPVSTQLASTQLASTPAPLSLTSLSSSTPVLGRTAPKPAVKLAAPMRSEIDAIDLLDTAGAPVLKRLAPVVAGALLLLVGLLAWRRRSH